MKIFKPIINDTHDTYADNQHTSEHEYNHDARATIQIGIKSYNSADIRILMQIDDIDVYDIPKYLDNLYENSVDHTQYFVRYLSGAKHNSWIPIYRPLVKNIKKLNRSASLSDIIDKINEIVDYLNNQMK